MNAALLIALCLLLCPVVQLEAAGPSLYVSPERGVYSIGETFDVQVLADTGEESINAAEAEIRFDTNVLEVIRLSTDDSLLSSWPTLPSHSNEEGYIKFSGWAEQHFNGSNGLLITITFRALRNDVSNAHLAAGAMLAADEFGSNIVTSMRSGAYRIEPKQIPAEAPAPSTDEVSAPEEGVVQGAFDELPTAPTIEYEREMAAGEHIIIRGTTLPSARMFVWLKHGEGEESRTELTSESDGSFSFVSGDPAEPGVYRAWVQVEGESGERSPSSERATISVRPVGLAAAAFSAAELATALFPLIALLVVGGLCFGYLLHKRSVARMKYEGG
jgi:hypothetical protein